MDPATTLRNFAADAEAGVSFQNSHNTYQLGFGRSITGRFTGAQGNGISKVEADFYTLPGLTLNGVSTNDLIIGMRAGIVKDVSVGFYGGEFRCQICKRDMLRDWECNHVPGLTYNRKEPDGSITEGIQAIAAVVDAHLAEVSAVFDGSTPGAAILKAQSEAQAGRMTDSQIDLLERRYRINLPTKRITSSGIDIPSDIAEPESEQDDATEDPPMAGTKPNETEPVVSTEPVVAATEVTEPIVVEPVVDEAAQQELDAVAVALDEVEAPAAETVSERARQLGLHARQLTTQHTDLTTRNEELTRQLADAQNRATTLDTDLVNARAQIAQLEPAAIDGRQYRIDLIAETLAEGVRANGAGFSQDIYRPLLENAPLETIKRMRADWTKVADDLFKPGRKTEDGNPAEPKKTAVTPTTPAVPDQAFMA
jgi:hypothetical protein